MAEEFSKRPQLQLWLGLNDREKEGEFVYNSNGKLPKIEEHWAGNWWNCFQSKNILVNYV